MADAAVVSPAPRKRRRWLRVLAWVTVVLIVLLVVVYFVATSSAFFKGVILPRVSAALNADVTVSDASIHPFKQVVLHNLKVQAKGQEPLLTAPEVRLSYSLLDIIGGNIHVDEVALVSPEIQLVQNPDGSSNLDPLTHAQPEKEKKPAEKKPAQPSQPSKPPRIDVRSVVLINGIIRQERRYAGGNRDVMELANLNIRLSNLKNGETGKLELSADIRVQQNPPVPGTNGALNASLKGGFTFALSSDLKPQSVQGQEQFTVARAEGSLERLAGLAATLNCDLTATELKQVSLSFNKSGETLGEIFASGPFNAEKSEGRIRVEVRSIDKRLLNLASAGTGLDFGSTSIGSTNEIQLANGGSVISASGRLDLNRLQLTRNSQTTPVLDFHADYDLTLNSAQSKAMIRALNLSGNENGNRLLQGGLTNQLVIAWGTSAGSIGDSAFDLTLTNFNLADWKPFLGDSVQSGTLSTTAHLLSQQNGKQVGFDVQSGLANLTAQAGSNRISQLNLTAAINGTAADLKQINLKQYNLTMSHRDQPVLTVAGSGTYNTTNNNADIDLKLQAFLDRLLATVPQPGSEISSGTMTLTGHVQQKQGNQTVTGNLVLADLNGKFGGSILRNFGTTMDIDVAKSPTEIQIRKAAGKLTQNGKDGGEFNVSGTYNPTNNAAQLQALLANFNEAGLGPFLQPALADKKLVSIAINGNASVQYDPSGNSTVKAHVAVTNLVVSMPNQSSPPTPLEAKLDVDAALQKQSADVRQFQVTLTPTDRAKNQIQFQGHVDFARSNAIQGNLKLAADSVDVTSYYDLLSSQKPSATAPNGPAKPQPSTAATTAPSNQEPPATQLPFQNFTVQATVGQLYLHEVEITNFQTVVKIDGGHVLLQPCELVLNGAPAKATVDADLGVPGYKYAVTFNADHVPFAPLANTFSPANKGAVGGTLDAHVDIKGAGITGASLQKNLTGQFDIGTTNLNYAVGKVRNRLLKTVINVIALLPEIAGHPENILGSISGTILGDTQPGSQGGLSEALTKSPIDVITARGTAGLGKIQLDEAVVRSPAFEADAKKGIITLADVLDNSPIHIPISISLSRSLADRINMLPANTPADAAYVKLPDFLLLTGTLGHAQPDKTKFLALGTSLIPGKGAIGGVIHDVGSIFKGGTSPTNTATNQPAKQSPVNNLLNRFLK